MHNNSLSQDPEQQPNTSKEPTPRKRSSSEKLASDYPSFRRQTRNPLSNSRNTLDPRGSLLVKLGLVEADVVNVPRIIPKVREAVGTIAEAIEIISGDDSPDSLAFMEKWNSLTPRQQEDIRLAQNSLWLEDVIVAAGLTGRRFMELLAGASYDHGEMMTSFYKSRHKLKVLQSTVKAATDEVPIMDKEGEVVGVSNGDVKAQELFFKLTGDIKPSGGVVIGSNNQTANITTSAVVERTPLQSMDSWLIELDEVRKPKQLGAGVTVPMIPVEIPENAPVIEYLPIEE